MKKLFACLFCLMTTILLPAVVQAQGGVPDAASAATFHHETQEIQKPGECVNIGTNIQGLVQGIQAIQELGEFMLKVDDLQTQGFIDGPTADSLDGSAWSIIERMVTALSSAVDCHSIADLSSEVNATGLKQNKKGQLINMLNEVQGYLDQAKANLKAGKSKEALQSQFAAIHQLGEFIEKVDRFEQQGLIDRLTADALEKCAMNLVGTVVGASFALQFDGTNSSVSIPGDNALACNPITIEFWLKGTGDGADHQVMGNIPGWGQQGGWDFDVYRTWIGRALFYNYEGYNSWGGVAGPTYDQVFDGQWHHFALIANDAVWHMYFDGVLADAYTENMRTILPTTYNLTIGHKAWPSAPVLPGLVVDELRISRVVRYTNSFIPAKTFTVDPDTVAYWRFNEGNGTTASDSSGNNHAAVLGGSPLPAWVPGVK
jgi:hypothetical protein